MEYNYMEEMKSDIIDYINDEIDFSDFEDMEELEQKLNEDLFVSDSVTGNASGSYYCNSYRAEEALAHNWDILEEALAEFGNEENPIEKGAEWCDVTIRCYLLGQAIGEVMEEIKEEFDEAHEEDNEEE